MNALQSELLKYKRTFMGKLIVFFPVSFAAYAFIMQSTLMQNPLSQINSWAWESLLALIFNWWSMMFLSIGFALFATLVASQEKKAGNYRALRTHNVSPMTIWINKIIAMAVYSFISTLVLIVVTIMTGLILKAGPIPFGQIIGASIVCWVGSLAILPIQLWLATWKGMFLSMGVGALGMIFAVLAASKPFWVAVPWSWAVRMVCPIINIHPNGTILEAGDPLLNTSVIPIGIVVSLVVFIVLTALTAAWFNRRDDK
ncbi:TPA: lantibiotic immunity ABC transporter MutE/EpiE family permease subunit [Clostridioides difficile]|uniref:lantibiotic immunity ABC transporter MutE/EpiE family permease subunit n=1 Tax=Clostridioides difficile TaxID=1496 RepID=UPI00097FF5B6|nr:lantibiotic immunity ABC transporter MutE/EpiE family permease subunit [Clostridioides difficile]MDV9569115.1 lantibiotic immunity ABC transporter MutE/EpiE family permease subunit [Clostridioides difficile]MDV9586171.1 lantibiotic immunity ABC transporter MutE/EpiE family permease subunit [Clostridioides difficile]MDV9612699.1 lantibiotic immunity ABC transporter MutE/EpiE family permease subunit [Clostridioides difficile]MDV9624506.1 lantibiotic immunity ABC transporter MutE/EpiE family pe